MKETLKKWVPVKVKNKTEYLVFKYLLDKGYKVYMPLLRYNIMVGEKESWRLKPIFKNKLFIYISEDEFIKLNINDDLGVSFYLKSLKPECISNKHMLFLKKVLSENESVIIVNRLKFLEPYLNIELPDFGEISLSRSEYKEREVIVWKVPVINSYVLLKPNSVFLKYLEYEYQDRLVAR